MLILPSAEVRWFVRGPVDPLVAAWFESSDPPPQQESPRVDHYLDRVDESLGIKLREGKIEVKRREAIIGDLAVGGRVLGVVERWRKWSFTLDDRDVPRDSWIVVEKRRRLRKYAIRDGRAVAVPAGDRPAQGCNVELTELRVADDSWWTLGLEAYGDESTLEDQLWLAARAVFGDDAPPLTIDDSYAYPAWLRRLAG
jgi:hypothetical protein